MPELPDITVYIEALRPRIVSRLVTDVTVRSPFIVRTFDPPIDAIHGKRVQGVERLGKRIVLSLDDDLFLVIHLMIAGRLLWKPTGSRAKGKIDQASFEFQGPADDGAEGGVLVIYEPGTQKRASLHLVVGRDALRQHHRGGLDLFACSLDDFEFTLKRENHTIKRTLTDPRLIDGVGNAYSDEILHAAKLSPLKLTSSMTREETSRLLDAARATLVHWTDALRRQFKMKPGSVGVFPGVGDITAFRPDFAAHGKYNKPCPVCGSPIQRIIYADNETNYCATCQTSGRVLADRSMSRLLKDDWPRRIEELDP